MRTTICTYGIQFINLVHGTLSLHVQSIKVRRMALLLTFLFRNNIFLTFCKGFAL